MFTYFNLVELSFSLITPATHIGACLCATRHAKKKRRFNWYHLDRCLRFFFSVLNHIEEWVLWMPTIKEHFSAYYSNWAFRNTKAPQKYGVLKPPLPAISARTGKSFVIVHFSGITDFFFVIFQQKWITGAGVHLYSSRECASQRGENWWKNTVKCQISATKQQKG